MQTIINYKSQPLAVTNNIIDWWLVIKALISVLQSNGSIIRSLTDDDFDEYRSKGTIQGDSVNQWINGWSITVWKYNELQNQFILQI